MTALKKSDPGVHGMLLQGRFAGCQGNLYRWEAPMGQDFYVTALNSESKRAAVAAALTQAAGAECRFEAAQPGQEEQSAGDGDEEALLESLGETFGKENLLIQEEPKA